MEEVEVPRTAMLQKGKYYEYAEITHREGLYPNERYFINVKPVYVGKFIKTVRTYNTPDSPVVSYFEDNSGKEQLEKSVNYSFEGNTWFREVTCQHTI